MVDVDVEIDPVAAVIGPGERSEAARERRYAVEREDFDGESEDFVVIGGLGSGITGVLGEEGRGRVKGRCG